jgi:hypothetical protein
LAAEPDCRAAGVSGETFDKPFDRSSTGVDRLALIIRKPKLRKVRLRFVVCLEQLSTGSAGVRSDTISAQHGATQHRPDQPVQIDHQAGFSLMVLPLETLMALPKDPSAAGRSMRVDFAFRGLRGWHSAVNLPANTLVV